MLTALLLAMGLATASAQTQTLTGFVTDAADGEPLMGATIKVKDTNAGVVTDLDGHYAVKVDNGQTLVVSYIGYITKSVKYTGQATLDVALSADNAAHPQKNEKSGRSLVKAMHSVMRSILRSESFSPTILGWSANCLTTSSGMLIWVVARML